MRWTLLKEITEIVPGDYALARATTDFPKELFDDHFPSFPVTPGVLSLEMIAQLSCMLTNASAMVQRGHLVFSVLSMVNDAKFRVFIGPNKEVEIYSRILEFRPESAMVQGEVRCEGKRCVTAKIVTVFYPDGSARDGDPAALAMQVRREFLRLKSPWVPEPILTPAEQLKEMKTGLL